MAPDLNSEVTLY